MSLSQSAQTFCPGGSWGWGGWGFGSGAETCLNPPTDVTEELFTDSDLTVVCSLVVLVVDDTHAS